MKISSIRQALMTTRAQSNTVFKQVKYKSRKANGSQKASEFWIHLYLCIWIHFQRTKDLMMFRNISIIKLCNRSFFPWLPGPHKKSAEADQEKSHFSTTCFVLVDFYRGDEKPGFVACGWTESAQGSEECASSQRATQSLRLGSTAVVLGQCCRNRNTIDYSVEFIQER